MCNWLLQASFFDCFNSFFCKKDSRHFISNCRDYILNIYIWYDNDSKHKSKSTRDRMTEKGILNNVMTTPASSPDLNPIENVWASMKYYLQTVAKPRTKDQLIQGIRGSGRHSQHLSVFGT